jgi:predicted nucleic acid-binding protein
VWLLDTNIASELVKRMPDPLVQRRYDAAPDAELAINSVTLFELRFGAARAPHPAKLWGRIERRILPRCQVLPLRKDDALAAADLLSSLAGAGHNITIQDILIAGTAWATGRTLVTRNTRHFHRIIGLKLEDWFEPPPTIPPPPTGSA